MKNVICAALLAAACAGPTLANAQVSVNVGVPGLYGRVDIGGYPAPPPVLYRQPTYVDRGPARQEPPLYLHVPPGHERHWRQHCGEYDACGRPVYFVQHDWYRNVYARRDGDRGGDRRGERGGERGGDRRPDDHRGDGPDRRGNNGNNGDDRDRRDNGR